MPKYAIAAAGLAAAALAVAVGAAYLQPKSTGLACVQASSTGSFPCKDAGGFDSTCATAACSVGYTLTGGGGACAAGDRRVKSLFPRFDKGEFTIACEQQGVAPQANAICCKV